MANRSLGSLYAFGAATDPAAATMDFWYSPTVGSGRVKTAKYLLASAVHRNGPFSGLNRINGSPLSVAVRSAL